MSNLVVLSEEMELVSNHEEANPRVLLHAKHAVAGTYDKIIIKTHDSDMFVLCITMQEVIGKDIFFMTGAGNNFKLIPIKKIADTMDEELCESLPGFHAFSRNLQ